MRAALLCLATGTATAHLPSRPTKAMSPNADAVTAFPLMMLMGSRRSNKRHKTTPPYDPFQCAGTCAGQQGYCPPQPEENDDSAFLELEAAPVAPVPPRHPHHPLPHPPLPGMAPNVNPAGQGFMGMAYPMLMMMGKRRQSTSISGIPMLHDCISTCRSQSGCGELPSPDGSDLEGDSEEAAEGGDSQESDGSSPGPSPPPAP